MERMFIKNLECEGRLTHIHLASETGGKEFYTEYFSTDKDICLRIAQKKCPVRFQMLVSIIKAGGLKIEDLHIQEVEEGVIRGVFHIRNSESIQEAVVRPSEALILVAILGDSYLCG